MLARISRVLPRRCTPPNPLRSQLRCSRARLLHTKTKGTTVISPPICRRTETLNREAFCKTFDILAVHVPTTHVAIVDQLFEELHDSLLLLRKIRRVIESAKGGRLLLLKYASEADLPPSVREYLAQHPVSLVNHKLNLDYDYWTYNEILCAILPEELVESAPASYERVGHIAFVHLEEPFLPYRNIIGQILLDKNSSVKTVVNKLRDGSHEVLAGDHDFIVKQIAVGAQFIFDATKFSLNLRKMGEYARLIKLFKPDDVVVDVYAGLGEVAIPAAKLGCGVYANESDPDKYRHLSQHIIMNDVIELARLSCGRTESFIRAAFLHVLQHPVPSIPPKQGRQTRARGPHRRMHRKPPRPRDRVTQVVIQHPKQTLECLSAFRGVLAPPNVGGRDLSGFYTTMPTVHLYTLSDSQADPRKAERDIRKRVEHELGHHLSGTVACRHVGSEQYCFSFELPREVAFRVTT